jgi:hypothetical protein
MLLHSVPSEAKVSEYPKRNELKSLLRELEISNSVPQGRLSVAQDAVLGKCSRHAQSRKGRLKVRYFQPSLRD